MYVWLLDPSGKTIYYDLHLLGALNKLGIQTELIASRYVHDLQITEAEPQVRFFFFTGLDRWSGWLKRSAYLRWGLRVLAYGFDLARFYRAIQNEKPDILHIQWTYIPLLDQFLFRRIATQIPIVLTVHNPVIRAEQLTRFSDVVPLVNLAQAVIVHTEQNRQMLLERGNIAPEKVKIVQHGALFEDRESIDATQARIHLGIPPDVPAILFFGNITPYKGLMTLLEAFPKVRAAVPGARLVVAGLPQGSFAPYQEVINQGGMQDAVHLHIHFIPDSRVPLYFAAANVVCLPYHDASQSGVLLSAYRFAKPVVVTAVGALPETVEDGKNGYVVPPADAPTLAEALIKLLNDPAAQQAFGEHSRYLAETRYSWHSAAEQTHQIYQMCLG